MLPLIFMHKDNSDINYRRDSGHIQQYPVNYFHFHLFLQIEEKIFVYVSNPSSLFDKVAFMIEFIWKILHWRYRLTVTTFGIIPPKSSDTSESQSKTPQWSSCQPDFPK